MELTALRPYSFNSIRSVFELHLAQVLYYLHRMSFTEAQYRTHTVPLTPASLSRLLRKTLFNLTIILLLFSLAAFPQDLSAFAGFTEILSRTLGNGKVGSLLSFIYAGTLTCMEDASRYSLFLQLKYRNTKLELIYEFTRRLDKELAPKDVRMLIDYFTLYSYLAGLCNKAVALAFTIFTLELTRNGVILWTQGSLSLFQLILSLWLVGVTQLLFFQLIYNLFTLLTGLFFIVKILKLKVHLSLRELAKFKRNSSFSARFTRFYGQYIHAHRQVLFYNSTIQEYLLDLDVCSKLFTSTILIFTLKSSQTTPFTYLLLVFYLIIYAYNLNCQFRLAFFQTKNYQIYKDLVMIAGKRAKGQGQLRVQRAVSRLFNLKLAGAIEFTSANWFGFTMGSIYLIDKNRVINSVLLNLYILSLLSKKVDI